MTLYLKYRPQKINELDLEEVRKSLTNIVKSGKIPHAFLFSGPKGTGKTSAARIIAKAVNCQSTSTKLRGKGKVEPCNKCNQCVSITNGSNVDVIELDAASHRGIDDIRALRQAVKLAPANAKKKVYIIDEAHMLTTEACNALLKTLEEPPEHVMFILATTNPEKLISTIRSRAVNIMFKRASIDEIVRSLKKKVKGEKIAVRDDALTLIAKASDHSFRDADKILEQLLAENKPLDAQSVKDLLFHIKLFDIDKFMSALAERDVKSALEMIEKSINAGAQARNILNTIIEGLRSCLMLKMGLKGDDIENIDKDDVILLLKLFTRAEKEMDSAYLEQIPIEIAIVEWCFIDESGKKSGIKKVKLVPHKQNNKTTKDKIKINNVSNNSISKNRKLPTQDANGISNDIWNNILEKLRPKNTTTEALLRAAKPLEFDGKNLKLGVYYTFHKERLEKNPHYKILAEVANLVLGHPVKIICTLFNPSKKEKPEDNKALPVNRNKAQSASNVVLTESGDEDIIKIAQEIFGN